MVLSKPKHAATISKQSNFSNYNVVMSDCLSLFIFPRLTIYRAVRLTNCYLSRYVETFRKCLPTFRMVAITWPSRSISQRRVHTTRAEIRRLSSVSAPPSPPLFLTLTYALQHPRSSSAPRHIGCSARSYTARSDPSLFPTQKPPFYMTLIQYHSDHTYQMRVEKCVTKCGKSSQIRHFL